MLTPRQAELTYLPLRLDDKRRAGRQRLKHKSEQSILNMCYRRLKKLGSQYPQVFDGFCAQNPQVAVRVRQCVVTHARAAQPTAAKTVTVVSTLGAGVDDRDAATTDRRAAAADRRAAAADLEAARADRESAAAYRAAASADRAKAANHRSTMVLDAAIRPRAFHNTDGVGAGARGALALALAVARPFAFGPHTHVPRTEDNNGSEDPSGASDGLCVICQDHKANVVLIDCKCVPLIRSRSSAPRLTLSRHMVMCKDCCGLILRGNASRRKCPICRAPIRSPSRKLTVFSS